jgi:hypothetical protein
MRDAGKGTKGIENKRECYRRSGGLQKLSYYVSSIKSDTRGVSRSAKERGERWAIAIQKCAGTSRLHRASISNTRRGSDHSSESQTIPTNRFTLAAQICS